VGRSIAGASSAPKALEFWTLAGLLLTQCLVSARAAEGPKDAPPPARAAPTKEFPVLEYRIDGNTLLPTVEIERAVMSHLGEKKAISDIEAARGDLEKAYRDRGYKTVVVNIPEQQVVDGIIRLHVTEAPVGKLHIEGSKYHSLAMIRDELVQLNEGTVPDFLEVQKELAQVNRTQDLAITPVLKASETPGRVDVDLRVNDKLPLHATVEVDNHYIANTTHLRTSGEIEYDNLFQRNHTLSFQYQIAPERPGDAEIWSASYVAPTRGDLIWALYAVHSNSNIGAVGDLSVIGKGNIYGLRLITPLPTPSRDFYHSFTGGVDYKDFKQSVILGGASGSIESPASYPLFTLQYSGTWLGGGSRSHYIPATTGGRSSFSIDASISFDIRGLGTNQLQFADKRAGASPSFFVFRPGLQREQLLPGAWSLIARVDGQLAGGPLINNEEFSAGGADSVRGYVESERLADEGIRGSLELRTPQLLSRSFRRIERSYILVFVDAAHLKVLDPLPNQVETYDLESAGLGLRFKAAGFAINLDGARIFKEGYVTEAGRYRGLFQVSYTY